MTIKNIGDIDQSSELHSRDMAIEIESILPALAESLYGSDWHVSLRELLQNAQDALTQRSIAEKEKSIPAAEEKWTPRIDVWIDRKGSSGTLVFQDDGIGLTEDEVHRYIATIGSSGKSIWDKTLSARKDLIGQFGIGFLASFIIGEKVMVTTQTAEDPQAPSAVAVFIGNTKYQTGSLHNQEPVGTTIRVELKSEYRNPGQPDINLLDYQKIEKAIRTCADNFPAPIFLHESIEDEKGSLINAQTAPWDREGTTVPELQDYLKKREGPFGDIAHVARFVFTTESNGIEATGLVYFPKSEQGFELLADRYPNILFVRRMHVTTGLPQLLPPWFSFAGVIVECPDLTLTLGRDRIIEHLDAYRVLREQLAAFIVMTCESWTTERSFRECYVNNIRRFTESLIDSNNNDPDKALFRVLAAAIPFHVRCSKLSKGTEMALREYAEMARTERESLKGVLEPLSQEDSQKRQGSEETFLLYLMTHLDQGRLRALAIEQPYPVLYLSSDTERGTVRAYAELDRGKDKPQVRALDVETLWDVAALRLVDQKRFEALRALCLEGAVDPRLGVTEVKVSHFKPSYMAALLTSAGANKGEADFLDAVLAQGKTVLSSSLTRYLRSQSQSIRLGKAQFTLHLNASNDIIGELADRLKRQPEAKKNIGNIIGEIILNSALPLFDDPGITEQLMGKRATNVLALLGNDEKCLEATRENTFLKAKASQLLDPKDAFDLSSIPAKAERRDCAVMILDLVKSTWVLGNIDIRESGEIFEAFVEMIADRVRSYQGHFDKFTGDGVLAEFFAEDADKTSREHATRNAFKCAKMVIDDIENFFADERRKAILTGAGLEGPKTRTALAWGPVNFGRYSGIGTAVGAPIVQAARLCNEKKFFTAAGKKSEYRIIGSSVVLDLIGLGAAEAARRHIEENWPIEGLASVNVFGLFP